MLILVHMASVWVPFTSESKEAIADYDEIRKEIRLAIAECGRRLGILLRRKRKRAVYSQRRDVFTRYIDEVVAACGAITRINRDDFRRNLIRLAKQSTTQADMEFDDHGKVIKKSKSAPGNDLGLADTIVVDPEAPTPNPEMLFDSGDDQRTKRKRKTGSTKRAKKPKRKARKR